MSHRILVVEDDRDVQELVQFNLEKEGYRVTCETDGRAVLPTIRRQPPSLMILDLMLPGLDGLEICRRLRRDDRHALLPILMLTARSDEADRVIGLELGADDYVSKPFSVRELLARVRALLRRQEAVSRDDRPVRAGQLTIDPRAHRVALDGRSVDLSALEFRLLHFLASHPGIVFSRDQLLDRVWGHERNVMRRSVDVYVRRLREKTEDESGQPRYVETVHGVGYRFTTHPETS